MALARTRLEWNNLPHWSERDGFGVVGLQGLV
jgi:hypothetical protein